MFNRRILLKGVSAKTLLGLHALGATPLLISQKDSSDTKSGPILNGFAPTDFPFRNLILGASDIGFNTGSFAFQAILDNKGYPTGTLNIAIGGSIPIPVSYNGRYILTWTGLGRLQLAFGGQPNQIVVHSGGANVVGLGRASGVISYNLTVDGANPKVEFTYLGKTSRIAFYFPPGGPYSGMSNLVLCRCSDAYAGDLAAIRTGIPTNCFNDDFIAKVKALRPSAIRVMDWIGVNNSCVTQFNYLPQWGYLTVADGRWLKQLWAGPAIGKENYSCGAAPDTPATWSDGEIIQCQFQNENTTTPILGATNNGEGLIRLELTSTMRLTSGQRICVDAYNVRGGQQGGGVWTIEVIDPTHIDLLYTFGGIPSAFGANYLSGGSISTATLNVHGRGSKLITSRFAGKANTSNATTPGIKENGIGTLVYDATLDVVMYRPRGLNPGVSLDVCVALANKLETGLWYSFPHMITDHGVASIVAYLKEHLATGLPCYLEYSNEVWNFSFDQTLWATNRGLALRLPSDNLRREYGWYGLRTRQVMEIGSNAWGSRPGLNRVASVQLYGSPALYNMYLFQGSDLQAFHFNSAPNRPIDYTDMIAYAPYYSGAVLTNFDGNFNTVDLAMLTKAADDYASGDDTRMDAALSWVDQDVRRGLRGGSLGGATLAFIAKTKYPAWELLAAMHNKAVVCYEGGYEGSAPSPIKCTQLGIVATYGGSNGSIGKLVKAYKNSSLFKQLVLDQWKQFMSLPHSEMPSWYTFGGGIQWSMLSGDLYSAPYQSYDAFREFSQQSIGGTR